MSTYNGGPNNDSYTGTVSGDFIFGNDGEDQLSGGAGGDRIEGGSGTNFLATYLPDAWFYQYPYQLSVSLDTFADVDTVVGGSGDDYIAAGYGDNIAGGGGNNRLYINWINAPSGINADFRLQYGGSGSITVGGGIISGISTTSNIQGSNFDDVIVSVADNYGSTRLYGNGGNDQITGDYLNELLFGGDGNDILDDRASSYYQRLDGGSGNDIIYANPNRDKNYGGDGNDQVFGGAGLHGDAGDDVITLVFTYYGGDVSGGDGNDIINGAETNNYLYGDAGSDTLYGGAGDDFLASGSRDPNSLNAVADAGLEVDNLYGGDGNDSFAIGYGDNIYGGAGADTVALSYALAASGVTLNLSGMVAGGTATVAGGTWSSIEFLSSLTGSAFNDVLDLSSQGPGLTVDGLGGNDTIYGTLGFDTLEGGAGNDTLYGGESADTLSDSGGTSANLFGDDGDDTLTIASTIVNGILAGGTGEDLLDLKLAGSGTQDISGLAISGLETLYTNGQTIKALASQIDGFNIIRDTANGFAGFVSLSLAASGVATRLDLRDELASYGSFGLFTVRLTGSSDDETVIASGGADTLNGGDGRDVLLGQDGNDILDGGNGNDVLVGGPGNDQISGGTGANELIGGVGDDIYILGSTNDSVIELVGEGTDEARTALSQAVLAANIEKLSYTGSGSFLGIGNGLDNLILGGTGRDELFGRDGNDTLNGNGGLDTLIGGLGNDIYLISDRGASTYEAVGEGTDEVQTGLFAYALQANIERLIFTNNINHIGVGNDDANTIIGGLGSDDLFGRGGNDTLIGGQFVPNTLLGQLGDDIYIIQTVGDSVVEFVGEGTDTVVAYVDSFVLTPNVENLVYLGTRAFTGIGSLDDNLISGADFDDFLSGLGGNDKLVGKNGADLLIGGDGADQFRYLGGETGIDRILDFTSGTDKIALNGAFYSHTVAIAFYQGAQPVSNPDANSTFYYRTDTGLVSYDPDGSGAQASVVLANVGAGLSLSPNDFIFL